MSYNVMDKANKILKAIILALYSAWMQYSRHAHINQTITYITALHPLNALQTE